MGDLEFGFVLADVADAITLERFGSASLRVDAKQDGSPVSDADRAAEEAIRELIAASGRGETAFGEEFGADAGSSDARWVVDPIDGTTNYVRGIPVWATLLALERDGIVTVAVISAPALGRRWWAERGAGAFADRRRCRVSTVSRLEDSTVSTTSARGMPPGWEELVRRSRHNRGFGDFWQHCLVAEGALDVACDSSLYLWDYGVLQLLVEEAGGRCSTFAGREPYPEQSFVSTNGVLHDDVVSLLSDVGRP